MGQYFKLINLDKKEFIEPHPLGAGLKFYEQVANWPGTGAALIYLVGEHQGSMAGRWARDRIILAGDYCNSELYECDEDEEYKDITEEVARDLEKFLGGKFEGDGWKKWVREG